VLNIEQDETRTVNVVRHLQRWPLGTGYPEIVSDVRRMIAAPELEDQAVTLALDATVLGRPVYDMFVAESGWVAGGLLPVVIHGRADEHHHGGVARVPKRELVSRAVKLLQKRELKLADTLPYAQTLVEELKGKPRYPLLIRLYPRLSEGYNALRDRVYWRRER
jgi:hypothetical protein